MLVARVVARLEPGGAQLSLLRVTRALARRGHATRLLAGTATAEGIAIARAHGVEPEVMGSAADLQWTCDPAFAAWLEPRLAGADVVHAHMLGAWWAAASATPAGVPLVASEHNSYTWRVEPPWSDMAEAAPRVDRFFAHGRSARTGALRAGIPETRLRAGLSPIGGLGARPRPGLPAPRIMYTGRLSADKGPDVLVDAVARMTAPPPVLIVGAGGMERELRAQTARLGLQATVRFCGWVEDPGPWVAGAAVQACPSRDEAFSQSAALAMGLGVPVVGTEVDGFPDTLAEGRGILVPPEDPEMLAGALEDVLTRRLVPDVEEARHWARQFDVRAVAAVYEHAYVELRDGTTTA